MKYNQDKKYKAINNEFKLQVDRLAGFIEISEVSFPKVKRDSIKACEKSDEAQKYLEMNIIRQCRMKRMRQCWLVLKKNQRVLAK